MSAILSRASFLRGDTMKASDFMTKTPITCTEDQTVKDAAKLMIEEGFSIVLVTNAQGELVGVVTESDFIGKEVNIPHALVSMKQLFGQVFHSKDVEQIYTESQKKKLKDVMTKKVITVDPEATLSEIVDLMASKNIKRVPVVSEGTLVGIVTRKDILRAFNSVTT